MEKYEPLGVVGEGSYGIVLKCKNRADNTIVAIKKFIDSEDDVNVRKIALREIRVLKKLRHENLVNLLEVFRRRKHLYLVFEFIDHTLLEQLEQTNHGLDEETCRKYIFQILRALGFCHDNSVIHRDVKPENVLVSNNGIVKLCDFGFARNLCGPGDIYTDYVATRWYRSPELLVGDVAYGKSVDIWAAGCLFAEMSTGEPLFPGDSDIDQLFLIAQCLGRLAQRHLNIMSKNSAFRGFQYPKSRRGSTTSNNSNVGMGGARGGGRNSGTTFSSNMQNSSTSGKRRQSPFGYEPPLEPPSSVFASMFPSWTEEAVNFLTVCLDPEPTSRPTCNILLRIPYFTHDNFPIKFLSELSTKLQLEGRPQLTTSSVRKRRSLVGGSNVIPGNVGGSTASLTVNPTGGPVKPGLPQGASGSTEEVSRQYHPQPFQSNNLSNQTQFSNSTNLSRQHTFVVKEKSSSYFGGKSGSEVTQQSRIPIPLTRKSSEEGLNHINGGAQGGDEAMSNSGHQGSLSTTKEQRFSVSQTPKKFSFSVMPQGGTPGDDLLKQEPTAHPLPVTTLTFNLGPHNMSYNGSTYTTSTIPAPVRAKSPSFSSSTNGFSGFGNHNLRRSSPGRNRKKISLGGGGVTLSNNMNNSHQGSSNPRSLPLGVRVLGSSVSMSKGNNTGAWSTSTADHFLPRMTPKNGISHNPVAGGIDENNPDPNPFPNYGNGNAFGKKREKVEPVQTFSQSRRSSFTTDLGNIKPFLNTARYERESTSPSKAITSTLPFM